MSYLGLGQTELERAQAEQKKAAEIQAASKAVALIPVVGGPLSVIGRIFGGISSKRAKTKARRAAAREMEAARHTANDRMLQKAAFPLLNKGYTRRQVMDALQKQTGLSMVQVEYNVQAAYSAIKKARDAVIAELMLEGKRASEIIAELKRVPAFMVGSVEFPELGFFHRFREKGIPYTLKEMLDMPKSDNAHTWYFNEFMKGRFAPEPVSRSDPMIQENKAKYAPMYPAPPGHYSDAWAELNYQVVKADFKQAIINEVRALAKLGSTAEQLRTYLVAATPWPQKSEDPSSPASTPAVVDEIIETLPGSPDTASVMIPTVRAPDAPPPLRPPVSATIPITTAPTAVLTPVPEGMPQTAPVPLIPEEQPREFLPKSKLPVTKLGGMGMALLGIGVVVIGVMMGKGGMTGGIQKRRSRSKRAG